MKQFLIGVVCGFVLALLFSFVPTVRADDDNPRSYKQYLSQMLYYMRRLDAHSQAIEDNTKALRDKLHA